MEEMIGNVKLNYDCYPGEDLYSDGEVEEQILEIVKTYSVSQYNKIIAQENSWPILYHLSHIRGNIVRQLQMNGTEDVLEVGSGCGAITGTLAEKAKHVTCVELSKKRSMINAYRNKFKQNIDIFVGNFEDIEKRLKQKYDIITLIGVFEYAANYIHSNTPYVDFLKMILSHVKEGGKVVIAIENKLGLKYFAGCKEDHVGMYYEGIEGYTKTEGIRTFTKSEWEKILKECGMKKYKFYYPYPDYKFPMSIYSDDYLPKEGELNINILNFDRERINSFDEEKVFSTLLENKLFPEFSNSYLIEIENGVV